MVFLNPELTGDLAAYRTENVGRLLAFAALAVGVRSIRDRGGWKEPVLAGALLATAAATHLVPVVVAVVLLGAYAAARAVIDRTLLPLLSRGAAILAVAGVLTVGGLVAAGDDVGLEGVTGSIRGAGFTGSFDPTRYLATGTFDQRPHVSVGGWYDPPGRLTQAFVASALGVASGRGLQVLLFLGAVALAVVVLLWFPREVRALGVTALGLAGGLLAMTLYFSFRYDTYIPAETGVRRLFDYSSVPVVLAGLAVVEAGLLVIPRRRTAAIVGAALAVALALALLPRLHPGEAVEGARSEAVVASIVAHVPCGARLLPTLRTEGVIEAATGRVSVLEGATPYLRPDVLRDTMRLLLAARDFFQEPAAHRSFLSDQGIDYLLVPHVPLGGYRLWKSDEAAIRSLPGLEPVVDAPEGELYRVTTPPAAGRFPDPADFPGYDCVRP